MDEKVREIKERNKVKSFNLYPNNIDPTLMKVIYEDVEYLLSRLEESEGFVIAWRESCEEVQARVKDLEKGIKKAVKKMSDRKSYVILGPLYIAPIERELKNLLPKKK